MRISVILTYLEEKCSMTGFEYSSPIANGYLFQLPDLLFTITDIGP